MSEQAPQPAQPIPQHEASTDQAEADPRLSLTQQEEARQMLTAADAAQETYGHLGPEVQASIAGVKEKTAQRLAASEAAWTRKKELSQARGTELRAQREELLDQKLAEERSGVWSSTYQRALAREYESSLNAATPAQRYKVQQRAEARARHEADHAAQEHIDYITARQTHGRQKGAGIAYGAYANGGPAAIRHANEEKLRETGANFAVGSSGESLVLQSAEASGPIQQHELAIAARALHRANREKAQRSQTGRLTNEEFDEWARREFPEAMARRAAQGVDAMGRSVGTVYGSPVHTPDSAPAPEPAPAPETEPGTTPEHNSSSEPTRPEEASADLPEMTADQKTVELPVARWSESYEYKGLGGLEETFTLPGDTGANPAMSQDYMRSGRIPIVVENGVERAALPREINHAVGWARLNPLMHVPAIRRRKYVRYLQGSKPKHVIGTAKEPYVEAAKPGQHRRPSRIRSVGRTAVAYMAGLAGSPPAIAPESRPPGIGNDLPSGPIDPAEMAAFELAHQDEYGN